MLAIARLSWHDPMQDRPSSLLKPLRKTLVFLGVMLLFAGSGSVLVRSYVLPQRMEALLHEAPAEQIAPRMDHLLSRAPLPHQVLAQLMASPRPEVSSEAAQRLELLVREWEQRPGHEIADEALGLVQVLRQQFSACSPSTQQRISQLVGRMAGWDLGISPAEQVEFLMAIEEVAKSAPHRPRPVPAAANEAMLSQYLQDSPPDAAMARAITPPDTDTFAVDLSAGLPWEPVEVPRVPDSPSVGSSPLASSSSTVSARAPSNTANRALAVTPPSQGQPSQSPPSQLPRLLQEPMSVDSVRHVPEERIAFDQLTTWEVIWRIHESGEDEVSQAEAELKRRRFDAADIELARRISSPQLATRLQTVRELPMMPRTDAAVWLYYMTKDPDETVRYAAAAALLTSADPRIHRQLKIDLATDPSLRVRELLQR